MGKQQRILKSAVNTIALMTDHRTINDKRDIQRSLEAPKQPDTYCVISVGGHKFPLFASAIRDAYPYDYPEEADIPEQYRHSHRHAKDSMQEIATDLFFNGGRLSNFGLKLKIPEAHKHNPEEYRRSVHLTFSILMQSMHVSWERKIGTLAWCLGEWYE